MPFITEILCPTNRRVLARFCMWDAYSYRLDDGIEFPLPVAYAWCHRCERFVECERLYASNEIQRTIDDLIAAKEQWAEEDARLAARFAELGRNLPCDLTREACYERWAAALAWRQSRKSPPRCLECGSFFAIKILPDSEEIPHPAGTCTIILGGGSHVSVSSFPDHVFFNGEGVKIDQVPYDEYRDKRFGGPRSISAQVKAVQD